MTLMCAGSYHVVAASFRQQTPSAAAWMKLASPKSSSRHLRMHSHTHTHAGIVAAIRIVPSAIRQYCGSAAWMFITAIQGHPIVSCYYCQTALFHSLLGTNHVE